MKPKFNSTICPKRRVKMQEILEQLKSRYPEVKFEFTSVNPIVLLHNSFGLIDDNDFFRFSIELFREHCPSEEISQALILYDVFGELK